MSPKRRNYCHCYSEDEKVMYIGPWQEYRLAKIQDDAIHRLRQEWEAQLLGQMPPEEDDRIREIMQPLVAKLPSMLRAARLRTGGAVRNESSRSAVQSEVGSRCSSRPASGRSNTSSRTRSSSVTSNASTASLRTRSTCSGGEKDDTGPRRSILKSNSVNNQDTHDETSSRSALKPPRPKKQGKKALTALEQVQKRKRMFATWIKKAGDDDDASRKQDISISCPEVVPEPEEVSIVTKLPFIHSAVPVSTAILLGKDTKTKVSSPLTLPLINQLSVSPTDPTNQAPIMSTGSKEAKIDLDESVDEEELNNLLNWTDTLLSPGAMDSLCDLDK